MALTSRVLSRLILVTVTLAYAQIILSQEKVLEVGEELKYEVSYGFIKLGFLKYNLSASRKESSGTVYNARLEIKTYPEVPFVKLNDIVETEMKHSDQTLYTERSYETNFRENSITRSDLFFDYKKEKIKLKVESDGIIEKDIELKIEDDETRYRDEVTWQYDGRLNSFTNKNFIIPVFGDGEEASVRYSYNLNKSLVKIELVPYDISVIKMEGTADYTGFLGFKGEFLIMLSDDEMRVPIKAYFNSSLGNIVLELVSYKKSKWTPPAFLK